MKDLPDTDAGIAQGARCTQGLGLTDVIRTALQVILQQLIDAEATAFIGAEPHERTDARVASPNEAMCCLKRRLSDIVYRTMLNDLVANKATGPGGHRGASLQSSAAGSHPHTGSSDKSLPGPAKTKPKRSLPAAS
jgi:hypothetical protein